MYWTQTAHIRHDGSMHVTADDCSRAWSGRWTPFRLLPLIALVLTVVLFSWRAFVRLDHWGIQDWECSVFYTESARVVVREYGQLPLWNPWFCGGTPLLARPEATCAGPLFIVPLIFGGFPGIRMLIPIYLAIGLLGGYRLGLHLGMSRLAAGVTALVFMCSGPFWAHLTVGNTWILPMGWMPWAILFFLKAVHGVTSLDSRSRNAAVASGAVLALIWLGGAPYLAVLTAVAIGLYTLAGWVMRSVRLMNGARTLAIIAAVSAGLSAVQLLPCLIFMRQFPRTQDVYAGFSLRSLAGLAGWRWAHRPVPDAARTARWVWLGVALAALWLSFGQRAEPLSLWHWLQAAPVFDTMRVPERFRIVLILCLAILGGWGLDAVGAIIQSRLWAAGVRIAIVIVIAIDLLVVVAPLLGQSFIIRPIEIAPAPGRAFVQTAGHYPIAPAGRWAVESDDLLRCTWSSHYPSLMANQGIVFGNEEIPVPMKAVPVEDPGYRGEVFLFGTEGKAAYTRWSPNVLRASVIPLGEGVVVFNQNYMPGWRVRGGGRAVEPVGGLLAVRVGAADRDVEIFYRPWTVIVGAWISVLTLLGLVLWVWRGRGGARR